MRRNRFLTCTAILALGASGLAFAQQEPSDKQAVSTPASAVSAVVNAPVKQQQAKEVPAESSNQVKSPDYSKNPYWEPQDIQYMVRNSNM